MTHPNDTLNGRLLAYELPEERHLRRRFGYWQMVEERMVREQMIAEGVDPDDRTFFIQLSQRIMENHKDDPKPWQDRHGLARFGAIRQQADYEREALREEAKDECVRALEAIRDGHNDPRALAEGVLSALKALDD